MQIPLSQLMKTSTRRSPPIKHVALNKPATEVFQPDSLISEKDASSWLSCLTWVLPTAVFCFIVMAETVLTHKEHHNLPCHKPTIPVKNNSTISINNVIPIEKNWAANWTSCSPQSHANVHQRARLSRRRQTWAVTGTTEEAIEYPRTVLHTGSS